MNEFVQVLSWLVKCALRCSVSVVTWPHKSDVFLRRSRCGDLPLTRSLNTDLPYIPLKQLLSAHLATTPPSRRVPLPALPLLRSVAEPTCSGDAALLPGAERLGRQSVAPRWTGVRLAATAENYAGTEPAVAQPPTRADSAALSLRKGPHGRPRKQNALCQPFQL